MIIGGSEYTLPQLIFIFSLSLQDFDNQYLYQDCMDSASPKVFR